MSIWNNPFVAALSPGRASAHRVKKEEERYKTVINHIEKLIGSTLEPPKENHIRDLDMILFNMALVTREFSDIAVKPIMNSKKEGEKMLDLSSKYLKAQHRLRVKYKQYFPEYQKFLDGGNVPKWLLE